MYQQQQTFSMKAITTAQHIRLTINIIHPEFIKLFFKIIYMAFFVESFIISY